jgi:hypothetical protein
VRKALPPAVPTCANVPIEPKYKGHRAGDCAIDEIPENAILDHRCWLFRRRCLDCGAVFSVSRMIIGSPLLTDETDAEFQRAIILAGPCRGAES